MILNVTLMKIIHIIYNLFIIVEEQVVDEKEDYENDPVTKPPKAKSHRILEDSDSEDETSKVPEKNSPPAGKCDSETIPSGIKRSLEESDSEEEIHQASKTSKLLESPKPGNVIQLDKEKNRLLSTDLSLSSDDDDDDDNHEAKSPQKYQNSKAPVEHMSGEGSVPITKNIQETTEIVQKDNESNVTQSIAKNQNEFEMALTETPTRNDLSTCSKESQDT